MLRTWELEVELDRERVLLFLDHCARLVEELIARRAGGSGKSNPRKA
jgi:hypothetical protein